MEDYIKKITRTEFDKLEEMEDGVILFNEKYLIENEDIHQIIGDTIGRGENYELVCDEFDRVDEGYCISDYDGIEIIGDEVNVNLIDYIQSLFRRIEGDLENFNIIPYGSYFWDDYESLVSNESILSNMIKS